MYLLDDLQIHSRSGFTYSPQDCGLILPVMRLTLSARPRSVRGLLLASFGLVALPLVIAIVYGVHYVGELTERTERLVEQGVQATRLSRQLTSDLTSMERSARQYAVLGNDVLRNRFADQHAGLQALLASLAELQLSELHERKLEELAGLVDQIREGVIADPFEPTRIEAAAVRFESVRGLSQEITALGNRFIDAELDAMDRTSAGARNFLLLNIFAVLPAALLLMLIFTALISRPIAQIRHAISRLGEGHFDQPVVVSAPSGELDALGSRLDWMRRRLAELEEEKNQFLRQMSHELKTPLASIREGVELIRDRSLGPLTEAQAEVADILQASSLELLSLIENLLNFAAWQQHRSQLQPARFDMRALVAEIVKRHQLTIDRKNLAMILPEASLTVVADRDQMRLVLSNLVGNAVKFSPERGRITVRYKSQRGKLTLTVSDEGPGVPADEREHIFTPFYQPGTPTNAHVQGTGIGLSVVREGVRAHGGDVAVDNTSEGGACFRIVMPAEQEM